MFILPIELAPVRKVFDDHGTEADSTMPIKP